MLDAKTRLMQLNRPKLLVRTARLGVANYNRSRDLKRILGGNQLCGPRQALTRLLDLEAEFDHRRRTRDAGYILTRHIEVLIALVAETMFCAEQPVQAGQNAPPKGERAEAQSAPAP
ncbi:hypothetical protein RSK20926_18542 [Roseobacter sp. SK209-2-6]|uniref:DUF6477 family protein n=1 Tax=Roseobacter sp. SK209-2-6 TaxID=388739 RepID=UPI0000F3F76E|nr:DUF6477 family protein [Roseobacter sp. SK209-2-6]EBA17765.1 hypothetical protein RSK20926_18542 [Roseobacter sp. SK209-2-6]